MFTSRDADSEEDAADGRRARSRDPWLAPVNVSVECDLVWGGYMDLSTLGKPLLQEGIAKTECEVSDFHSKRMNSPPQTSSPEHWAQASLRYPIVAQATQNTFASPQVVLHQSAASPKPGT